MTTKNSPRAVLKAQADKLAAMLKRFEQGKLLTGPFAQKLEAARGHPSIKFGIIMDDKVLTIDMPWTVIRDTDERGISEWIISQMSEERPQ